MIQAKINKLLLHWQERIKHFREALVRAAQSEAAYKHERAKFILAYKAHGERISQAEAETAADADETLHKARLARLADDAEVEACKAEMHWFREHSQHLRSDRVDERQRDQLYADHPAGA